MILHLFKRSEFAKNTATLVIGTIIAQAIPLLLHPLLRRVYSPEEFGVLSVYLNVIGILIIVTSLRYEAAIVLPKNNNEASNVLFVSLFFNLVLSICIGIVMFIFTDTICQWINFPVSHAYLLTVLPFGLFLLGVYNSLNYWLIREKAFKASAINKLSRRGVEGIGQTYLGYIGVSSGLVFGDVLGNMANVLSGVRQVAKTSFKWSDISPLRVWYVIKKYKEFPLYNLIPSLLSAAASLLPILFINKLYSTEAVGYVDLSRLVLSIPLAFLSVTIAQVLFQNIAEKWNKKMTIKPLLRQIFVGLFIFGVIEIVLVLLFGPLLFGFVFGAPYVLSGEYAQWLVYSYVLNFIVSSLSAVFIALKRIKLIGVWQVFYFLAICSLLFFEHLPLRQFIQWYVFIEVVMYLLYIVLIIWVVKKYEQQLVG